MSTASKVALYEDATQAWGIIHADALKLLAALSTASVDAIVTDPPYMIDMAAWDGTNIRKAVNSRRERLSDGEAFERWTRLWAAECRRVLKPGGHAVFFGSPRVFHRLVSGIETAFEVRDQLLWLHSQGLPKARRLPGGLATTLKPAYEPILLARAPFEGNTVGNLAVWGTGALNIDATRIASPEKPEGYWPAHVALSHSQDCRDGACASACPVGLLDQREGEPPSRLFYCAKASRVEREAGCEQLPKRSVALYTGKRHSPRLVRNLHPTVKPISLMRWLVRLITPPGGLVLDPFTGSGTTGIAAVMENRIFLGIEREAAYVDIACARLTHWAAIAAQEEVLP